MTKKQKHENDYYLERLKIAFPSIYADLPAGKIESERQAYILVGPKTGRTRLQALENDWKRHTIVNPLW